MHFLHSYTIWHTQIQRHFFLIHIQFACGFFVCLFHICVVRQRYVLYTQGPFAYFSFHSNFRTECVHCVNVLKPNTHTQIARSSTNTIWAWFWSCACIYTCIYNILCTLSLYKIRTSIKIRYVQFPIIVLTTTTTREKTIKTIFETALKWNEQKWQITQKIRNSFSSFCHELKFQLNKISSEFEYLCQNICITIWLPLSPPLSCALMNLWIWKAKISQMWWKPYARLYQCMRGITAKIHRNYKKQNQWKENRMRISCGRFEWKWVN